MKINEVIKLAAEHENRLGSTLVPSMKINDRRKG